MIPQGLPSRKDTYNVGVNYRFSVLIDSSEMGTYFVPTGSDVTALQSKEAGPLIVKSIARNWLTAGKVRITYDCVNSLATTSSSMLPTKTNRSYSVGSFQFYPAHFGVHKAQEWECSADNGGSAAASRKNIDEADASVGDWVFNNATINNKGEADYTACPLDMLSGPTVDAAFIQFALANNLQTVKYTVRFPGKTGVNSWIGTSGSWGGYNPDFGGSGSWIARESKSEMGNGKYYTIRMAESGPQYAGSFFRWQVSKFPNWTW